MTKVNVALLADPTMGGWPSFTAHLIHGLQNLKVDTLLYRVSGKTEKRARPFGRGLSYHNITLEVAERMAQDIPTIIAAVGPKHVYEAANLLQHNACVVIHDPTELSDALLEILRQSSKPVVIIRKKNREHLAGIEVIDVLHPYQRAPAQAAKPLRHAAAFSRLDWDKNTHIIVEANNLLPNSKQITIYGAINRMYTHHKVDPIDAQWERNYKGAWPARAPLHHAVTIARNARYAVDLSVIKGDGGGTQYSFLEAFDAERPLIIHQKWLTGDPTLDEIAPALAATVTNAAELADLMQTNLTYDKEAAEHILHTHKASTQAKTLLQALGVKP